LDGNPSPNHLRDFLKGIRIRALFLGVDVGLVWCMEKGD
jgi:hypothetical protein